MFICYPTGAFPRLWVWPAMVLKAALKSLPWSPWRWLPCYTSLQHTPLASVDLRLLSGHNQKLLPVCFCDFLSSLGGILKPTEANAVSHRQALPRSSISRVQALSKGLQSTAEQEVGCGTQRFRNHWLIAMAKLNYLFKNIVWILI